jgi:hypothetical protein
VADDTSTATLLREHLCALTERTPLLAGLAEQAFIDIDSLLRPVYGHAKQGASYGHTKIAGTQVLRKGLSPLATTISTGTPLDLPATTAGPTTNPAADPGVGAADGPRESRWGYRRIQGELVGIGLWVPEMLRTPVELQVRRLHGRA